MAERFQHSVILSEDLLAAALVLPHWIRLSHAAIFASGHKKGAFGCKRYIPEAFF